MYPTRSALNKDRHGQNGQRKYSNNDVYAGDDDNPDENARELPNKVDKFVQYINDHYFDGQLNAGGKDIFKKGMDKDGADGKRGGDQVDAKRIYNGDDNRGASPRSRRVMVDI